MNNAKHTPGPWVAALGERLNTDVYHIDKQGNRVFVAEFATQTDAVPVIGDGKGLTVTVVNPGDEDGQPLSNAVTE